jgi:hypothetical protein
MPLFLPIFAFLYNLSNRMWVELLIMLQWLQKRKPE